MYTCSSFFGSKGESPVTRFTAAKLIPGGAIELEAAVEDCSDSVVSDSADWDDSAEPDVSTLGCCDVVLKIIHDILYHVTYIQGQTLTVKFVIETKLPISFPEPSPRPAVGKLNS